ncbi:MAG: phenylacetate--CoA ligase [Desulfovibrio sp.]|jgi:phenylacetate-CoA ligase|nr:phenylacetate--CoA ligase [Desulfovibrio sp.]
MPQADTKRRAELVPVSPDAKTSDGTSVFLDESELWDRDRIASAQVQSLRAVLKRAAGCGFYRERLAGLDPMDIASPADIARIPFTTKDDLRSQYPLGLLCVPRREIVRMHSSSGTTGNPVAVCHTRGDLGEWAGVMARCLYMVGVRPDDVFQNMSGYGLFTGGLGIHFGAERLGCMTIPAGPGNSRRQIKLLRDFGTTAIHVLPSYALILADHMRELGEDPKSFPLRVAVVGAEPYSEEFRLRLQNLYDMDVFNSYGLSEMSGPGVAFECPWRQGLHVWEDHFLPEIVDVATGEPVPDGEVGELVLTSLRREGMPILRYRTRDLTRFLPGDCPCGRRHRRIDRILGRADDMFIVKGVNIYPMQIERVIMTFPDVGHDYRIVLENDGLGDVLRVQIEMRDAFFEEDMRKLQSLQKTIAQRLRSEILVTPRVELVEGSSLPKTEGKAVRVVDMRRKD